MKSVAKSGLYPPALSSRWRIYHCLVNNLYLWLSQRRIIKFMGQISNLLWRIYTP